MDVSSGSGASDDKHALVLRSLEDREETFRELSAATGVNYWWLIKFYQKRTSGYSKRGFEHVNRLAAYFEQHDQA